MKKQTAVSPARDKKQFFRKIRFALSLSSVFLISHILQVNLSLPVFLLSLVAYLNFRKSNLKNYSFLNLMFLFVISFVSAYFLSRQGMGPIFYLPFCAIPMLTTLLFNQLELSLLIIAVNSLSIAFLGDNYFYIGVLSFISGLLSSVLVLGTRRRMAVIRAGFIIGFLQALILFFIDGYVIRQPTRYLVLIINGIVSSIIVLGVLPLFEYLFGTITDINLLELADFNHPLLQRLASEAPGTYHHSLVVGNLSEAACRQVGANALLARIGAYYHDIGKLHKPDYFGENQNIKENKHDTLSPVMSKLVIMNHVKEGVELAKKYKLNARLIDFMLEHHGNSLVYYFYRRALESLEEDQEIKEEGFRYPGPKPHSKETAIVLLADSVEAAARALKEPAVAKIEELVHKIINNKFIDGQLDECDLTLKDLDKIAAVFIHVLGGIYHNRITYPEGSVSL